MNVLAENLCFGVALAFATLTTFTCAFAQDAAKGQKIFQEQCSGCHSPLQGRNLAGPSLFKVVGRTAGKEPGFQYSAANRESEIIWTVQVLDKFLAGPQKMMPGTFMTFPGLAFNKDRKDVIAYLTTLE